MGKLAVYRFTYYLFTLFTLLILGLTIFSFFAGKIDPTHNIYAAYVALCKPILFIINVLILIYWLLRVRIWMLAPIIALAVNYDYSSSMFQVYNRTKHANETTLSVMTYNVRSFGKEITGFSAKEFLEKAKDLSIDVICFQEYAGNADFTDKDIYELYSSYFPYSFVPENQSNAIYSRYPIKQSQAINFQGTNNNATWIDLEINRAVIRVINVHMQTTSFDRMSSKLSKARANVGHESGDEILTDYFKQGVQENLIKRANQAKTIESLVQSTDYPVVLCGDLNDLPGTYTYETLKGNLKDGFKTAGVGYASTYRRFHNLLRIDYIFHSPNLMGIKYETIPYEMSDHNPVYMMVSL
ncbi:MAG: endonuclease/exonuclease/phosphatase family protein [Phocaeicola sp.]